MSAQLTFSDRVDAAIDALGRELLRELAATAWFCDGTPDGRHPLLPRGRHARYEPPGGDAWPLVRSGCVRVMRNRYCGVIARRAPAISVSQFGRAVLSRARARRIDVDGVEAAHG